MRRLLLGVSCLTALCACKRKAQLPPAAHLPPTPGPVISARLPRPAALPATRPRHSLYRLSFRRIPLEVTSMQPFSVEVQVLDNKGQPVKKASQPVVLMLADGPKGFYAFRTGNTMRPVQNGIAVFQDLSLEITGNYRLEAVLGDVRVRSDVLRVKTEVTHQVKVWIDGKLYPATYVPPDKYILSDGETYDKVPRGEQIMKMGDKSYRVVRDSSNNVRVTTVGKK